MVSKRKVSRPVRKDLLRGPTEKGERRERLGLFKRAARNEMRRTQDLKEESWGKTPTKSQ